MSTGRKFGLVLEGGGMRALFTCGVIDVLMENGIMFDGMVGVSAGAAFGCNYKSRQIGRPLRYNLRFAKDWRYCSLWSLLTTGNMFGAKFAYHTVHDEVDIFDIAAFERNPMEFHMVATDVLSGKAVYKKLEHGGHYMYEWLRASSSMPVISKVVHIDGKLLLDGGITDSIPLRYFQSQGYACNIVVLTQPKGFLKKPVPMMWFLKFLLRRYPRLIEALSCRHQMYNEQLRCISEEEAKGNILVISPEDILPIGRISHNREQMVNTYNIGRETTKKLLDEIVRFYTDSKTS